MSAPLISQRHALRMKAALEDILSHTNGTCASFSSSGIGECFRSGRTPRAEYGADQCCEQCIADRALHGERPRIDARAA